MIFDPVMMTLTISIAKGNCATLQEIEDEIIVRVFADNGSSLLTAKRLGVSVRSIQYKLKKLRAAGRIPPSTRKVPGVNADGSPVEVSYKNGKDGTNG